MLPLVERIKIGLNNVNQQSSARFRSNVVQAPELYNQVATDPFLGVSRNAPLNPTNSHQTTLDGINLESDKISSLTIAAWYNSDHINPAGVSSIICIPKARFNNPEIGTGLIYKDGNILKISLIEFLELNNLDYLIIPDGRILNPKYSKLRTLEERAVIGKTSHIRSSEMIYKEIAREAESLGKKVGLYVVAQGTYYSRHKEMVKKLEANDGILKVSEFLELLTVKSDTIINLRNSYILELIHLVPGYEEVKINDDQYKEILTKLIYTNDIFSTLTIKGLLSAIPNIIENSQQQIIDKIKAREEFFTPHSLEDVFAVTQRSSLSTLYKYLSMGLVPINDICSAVSGGPIFYTDIDFFLGNGKN